MRSLTSSPDRICILSSLSWKEGEKEDKEKKREKKGKKKKEKEGEEKEKKSVRKKKREEKKLDLSRINLVPEFGLESILRTVQ